MSDLSSFSLINQKVEKIYKEENTETKGNAFIKLCLRIVFKLNDDEIEETITDGPMDGEVDAIYIQNKIVNIMTFKYTDSFKQSQKNYPENELDQFNMTISHIISGTLDEKTINQAIWEKYQEILNLSQDGRIDFKIYVISNKEHPVEHAKIKLENTINRFQLVEKPFYFNQENLVSIILENKKSKVNGRIQFIEFQHFDKADGNIRTIIGAIPAIELVRLIKDPNCDDVINEQVFNENVRIYKSNHRVNKAIIDTANSPDNYQFFYLNNGITILCEQADYIPHSRSPIVSLTNLQIINGGQTSHSLFEVYKENHEKVNSIDILVRVCVANSEDPISQRISETSNNQIPIGSRDLHSNDNIQRKLQEEFEELGYFYERKPNENSDKSSNKVLNNELLGQLYMAYHLEMPSEAKNNKSRVFGDMYDLIFNENQINASKLLRLYKLYTPLLARKKEIQQKKRRREFVDEKEAFISRATFHIVSGTKFLFEKEENLINSEDITTREKESRVNNLYHTKGSDFTSQVINLIYSVVIREMSQRGDVYTHDKFFKEIQTNNMIKTYILENIQ